MAFDNILLLNFKSSPSRQMASDKISQVLAQDDTVLFIGAGVSLWSGLPSWAALINKLAEYIEAIPVDASLVRAEAKRGEYLQAASYGFDKLTKFQIGEFIRESCQYGKAKPHEIHKVIVTLGPRCYITTNYDNLIEESLRQWQKDIFFPRAIINKQLTETAGIVQARSKDFVFKPHGDAGDIDSIILTREQYRKLQPGGELQSALETVKTLLASRPVVYIGFGLRDPDFMYIRDLLDNTYKGAVRDHYAIMADISEDEISYWRKNYGIHLIGYQTTENPDGSRNHSSLLKLLIHYQKESESIRRALYENTLSTSIIESTNSIESNDKAHDEELSSGIALALARHAARVTHSNTNGKEFPVNVRSVNKTDRRSNKEEEFNMGNSMPVEEFLGLFPIKAVMVGLPGAGKSYAISKAASKIASSLQAACMLEGAMYSDLTVPILIDLKVYDGNLWALAERALPNGVSLDFLLANCNVKILIDSFNEMPREYREGAQYEADFNIFFAKASNASIIISSRTDDGLSKFEFKEYVLDEIDRQYIEVELENEGIALDPKFKHELTSMLQKPFYFRLVTKKLINLDSCKTPGDIYKSLLNNTQSFFLERFSVGLDLTKALSIAAYEAINSGEEAMPLAYLVQAIKIEIGNQKIKGVTPEEVANWLVSASIITPYSGGRIAFFHQSLTEYLASTKLAEIYLNSPDILKSKLLLYRWDQAIFLALGHLGSRDSNRFLQDIIKFDFELALNATKYLEAGSEKIVSKLLRAIPKVLKNYGFLESRIEWLLETSVPITNAHEPDLLALMEHGNVLAGAAFVRLADLKGEQIKTLAFDLLIRWKSDYNYCANGISKALKKYINEDDIPVLISMIDKVSAELPDEPIDFEKSTNQGFITGVANLLEAVPLSSVSKAMFDSDEKASPIKLSIFNELVQDTRTQEGLEASIKLLEQNFTGAPTSIYFIIRFGDKDNTYDYSSFGSNHIDILVNQIKAAHKSSWAVSALRLIGERRPDLLHSVEKEILQTSGIINTLLHYCLGPANNENVFKGLESLLALNSRELKGLPFYMLEQLELDWTGREELLVRLIKIRNIKLAYSIVETIDSVYDFDGHKYNVGTTDIGPIQWWLEWLLEGGHKGKFWWFEDRLPVLLKSLATYSIQHKFVQEFNKRESPYRDIIARSLLQIDNNLTTDDLSEDGISFLLAALSSMGYDILGNIATEKFVAERLLPLLPITEGKMKDNLISVLRKAGKRHGRRYIVA